MRESPWRSFARLLVASAVVAVGACAPKLDLSNRPPPCVDGYSLCPATGACMLNSTDDTMPVRDPSDPSIVLPMDCPSSVSVIQGGTVNLAAPGARLEDVTVDGIGDLKATSIVDARGGVAIAVNAPHGSPEGEKFQGQDRFVTITTTLGGYAFVRRVLVVVSFITAAPGGSDDSNDGTVGRPFATLGKAASVAAGLDTIAILGAGKGQTSTNLPGSGVGTVMIPDGVTIVGTPVIDVDPNAENAPITISVDLELLGDATLTNLDLAPRLTLRKAGHHVSLANDLLERGLTISREATAPPGTTGTSVEVATGTVVTLPQSPKSMPIDGPLLVQADGASVTLGESAVVTMPEVQAASPLDAIRFEGTAQALSIAGSARIVNLDGGDALHVIGSTDVTVGSGARFINPVEIGGSMTSTASFDHTSFNAAPLTFQGRDLRLSDNTTLSDSTLTFQGGTLEIFDTSIVDKGVFVDLVDIVASKPGTSDVRIQNGTFQNAPVTFGGHELSIQGITSFTDSLLTFQGKSLIASDAVFSGQGILHNAVGSTSMLTNVQITNYQDFGYRLVLGSVNVFGGAFIHDPAVPANGTSGPFALRVEAAGDTESSVNSHSTLYDGAQAPPVECSGGLAVSFGTLLWVGDPTVPISLCP
jgi:hypothetical protein